eukprot:gb/GEZN01008365.1/.p1 GENE.gb/GEZN01008365.1/~~gb/GEZN01008365.1/.p1  ORF type:complete len:150 (-),score=18.30 gb/GEZN01008365.1/:172-621(-)
MCCQQQSKVFFRCNNPRCGIRACQECHSLCDGCQSIACKWCLTCAACHTAEPSELTEYLRSLSAFCAANAKTLSAEPGWPGNVWISQALSRLSAFEAQSLGDQVSPGAIFVASLMSLDWQTEGERRAWSFLVPLLRAQLSRSGAFNLPP